MENSLAFDLNAEHSRDVNHDDCITIDAGKDENGPVKNTLVHIRKTVAKLLENPEALMSITKLYVVGDFIFDLDIAKDRHGKGQEEASDPWTFLSIVKSPDSMAGASLTLQKPSLVTPEEYEWTRAVECIDKAIQRMGNLLELTWISGLPFLDLLWRRLSRKLVKLRFDIRHPVHLDASDFRRRTYFQQRDMKPLKEFVMLKELRIFRMTDSYQSIVWETVWRNEAEKKMMDLLDLRMLLDPIIRSGPSQTKWTKADGVKSLMKLGKDDAVDYHGMGGKGTLHHSYGHREYLDVISIRKARLAAGIAEDVPFLPLLGLILDGFVVDSLPFEIEMNAVSFLQLGQKCYDAGFTPTNQVGCNENAGNFTWCPATVVWPNWTAKFRSDRKQLDAEGDAAGEAESEDEAEDDFNDCLTLTTERLEQLDLDESAAAMRSSSTQPTKSNKEPLVHGGEITLTQSTISGLDGAWEEISPTCSAFGTEVPPLEGLTPVISEDDGYKRVEKVD